VCANNLKQIGLALHGYHDVQKHLPPGVSIQGGRSPQPFLSWNARILPYLEQAALWSDIERAFEQNRSFYAVPPHTHRSTVVAAFACPSDGRTLVPGGARFVHPVAFTAYLGVSGSSLVRHDGILFQDSETRLGEITDGISQTLLVGERPPSPDERFGWWYAGEGQRATGSAEMIMGVREFNITYINVCWEGPYTYGPGQLDNTCDTFHFWSLHPGGAHFLFADGAVRLLAYSAAPHMTALATRAGNDIVGTVD
jgi:prepilin-type processing-associated H-X9-DG protein